MPTISLDARRPFGRTGLSVSPLGFGGAPIGFLEAQRETAAAVLDSLLDMGVNLIDTAAMYRGSEELIGDTVARRRDEFVLVSKCGHASDDLPGEAWSDELVTASIERSLRRLRTDRLDVMLLHSCDLDTLREGSALRAVVRAKEAGKVRFVGYSGDNEAVVWAAAQPEIDVIQTSVNICDQVNIDGGVAEAGTHGVGVMAKRPLANACWKGDAQYERYRDYAAPYLERFETMSVDLEELGFDGDPDALWPEIALRFTAYTPGVHVAIVGTTRPDRVAKNVEAILKGPLPDAAYEAIRSAFNTGNATGTWVGRT